MCIPKRRLFMLLAIVIASILIESCESHEPKVKDDFEVYKQDKISSADSDSINKEAEYLQLKADAETPVVNTDEWTAFSNLIERKISANTSKIKSIRAKPGMSSKMLSKANRLEKENADLHERLVEFKSESDERLKLFSEKIKADAESIGNELKEISAPQ